MCCEIGFFQEFLLNNHLLRAYYLGFDRSSWIVLIKSEILITTGMVWPVRSDKWKVPYVYASGLIVIRHLHISHNTPYSTPKIVDNLCCWFLQDITVIPREIETVVGREGGGANMVYYGRYANGKLSFFCFFHCTLCTPINVL